MNSKTKKVYDSLTEAQKKLVQKKVNERMKSHGKIGGGFFSNLVSGVKSVASQASAALPAIKNTAIKVANAVASDNKPLNDKWVYDAPANEKLHQVFKAKDGNFYTAKFSGPGDIMVPKINALWDKYNGNVSEITNADNFADPIDLSAFLHDVLYTLAGDEPDKESVNKAIRAADLHLIDRLQKQADAGNSNAAIPLKLIKVKVAAEDKGAPVYGANEKIPDDKTRDRLNKIAEHLKMKGYGDRPLRGDGASISKQVAEDDELGDLMNQIKQLEKETGVGSLFSKQIADKFFNELTDLSALKKDNRASVRSLMINAYAYLKSLKETQQMKSSSSSAEDSKKGNGRKQSNWVLHVKEVAKDKGIKYGEALKIAGASFNK